tara:strand:+ start:19 stop:723 length:705 start_codon:yes stop_codon:yes gene_type:complete
MKIAIIIARGNSQRIKNKNIKLFNGAPILKVTYKLLKSFKIFDKIILSTDSQKIIKVCSDLQFDDIIKRPKKLGDNKITTIKVVNHSINILKKDLMPKYVCCVYPCSPLLEKKDILESFKLIKEDKDFVFPLLPYPEPIEQALSINNVNELKYIFPKNSKKNTDQFSKKYYDAGQFYTSTIKGWNSIKKNFKGIKLQKYSTVDIDDMNDWNFANYLYQNKKNKKNKKNEKIKKT